MTLSFFVQELPRVTWVEHAIRALNCWDIGQVKKVHFVGIRENSIFRVESSTGQYALRFHRPGYQSHEAIKSEMEWVKGLISFGINCPEVIPAKDHCCYSLYALKTEPKPVVTSLVKWLPGIPLDYKSDLQKSFFRLGELTSRLHTHSLQWEKPSWFERPHWDAEGLVGKDAIWGNFDQDLTLDVEEHKLLQKVRRHIIQTLDMYGKGGEHYGLVHADMLPENILQDEQSMYIIDFDDCGYGYWLYDLAAPLMKYVNSDFYQILNRKWLEGYSENRSTSLYYADLTDTLVMARLLKSLGWINTRSHTETAKINGTALRKSVMRAAHNYMSCEGRFVQVR